MSFIFVYITASSLKEATKISKHLLEKKLAACTNIFPIASMYLWKRKIKTGKEFAIITKAPEKNYGKIKAEVEKIHSYSVPCITKIKVNPNEKYAKWLRKETN